jgi:hypothetical protein
MEIKTCVDDSNDPAEQLEHFRAQSFEVNWSEVADGYWGEDTYHNGCICYSIAKRVDGTWVLDATSRYQYLDDLTQEDIDEGMFINDDQAQTLHDFRGDLEAAQKHRYSRIVAIGIGFPQDTKPWHAGEKLYKAVVEAGGKEIIDFDPDL